MNDIVERLRKGVDTNEPPDRTDDVMYDAAGEIERLRAALSRIAHDAYTREDKQLTGDRPMMIWQIVAMHALAGDSGEG